MHGRSGIVSASFLGTLSPDVEEALQEIMTSRSFAKGTILFQQGTPASGIYLVESGTVRVLLPTAQNQNQLLDVVGAGSILGLSECMAGESYRVTTEADGQVDALFITGKEFSEFLNSHQEFCMQVVRLLSENLHTLYHKFRGISAHPGRPRHRPPNQQMNWD